MMVVPLPTIVLDMLLAVNITGAVSVLLISMYVQKPLDFSVFPSLLLIATMFRLALNVSATRLVLLHGFAGKVIESFGHFVVGGSIVVGLVIFLILIVIQFIVITNGAGRVAEVAARFTLDAMPGKQMAIDADLNAGAIDEVEARRRRQEVSSEADFYGAMDGASKFVKGDAIAAIIITMINLFGGFIVGVVQHHINVSEAISTYSLLSVGDGLVSQIPALLISVSTGLIVTRAATDADMGSDLLRQFGRQTTAMRIAGVAVSLLAIIPGLPKLPFVVVGGLVFFIGFRNKDKVFDEEQAEEAAALALTRTRDNLNLPQSTYSLRVQGVELARGECPPGTVLAIGDDLAALPGTPTREPVFGLVAKWVPVELRHQAELAGATVVDPSSVITTHLAEVVRTNAGALLGRQDVKTLVDMVKAAEPVVIDELNAAQISLAEVQGVLRDLLDEGVAIRNLVKIFEVLSERGRTSREPEVLVESVRHALGPAISAAHAIDNKLPVLTFEPIVEQ